MSNAKNDKFRSIGNDFSSSSVSDDHLLSLLRRPLPYLDEPATVFHPPASFENPLDDPRLEPLPLGVPCSAADHTQVSSEPILARDDSFVSSFRFARFGAEPTQVAVDNCHHMTNNIQNLHGSEQNSKNELRQHHPLHDPLEPLPLSTNDPFTDYSLESIFTRNNSRAFSFCAELGKTTKEGGSTSIANVAHTTNAAFHSTGSKRAFLDALEIDDDGSENAKRQRVSNNPDDYIARFRPSQEKQWQAQFEKLVQFKNRNGHCRVPQDFPEDQILSRWVRRQRHQYKKFQDNNPRSTMTRTRIRQLESIDFIWNYQKAAWREKFDDLILFKQRTGHCNVPSNFPENEALASWVLCQRRQYKRIKKGKTSHLTEERYKALEALGFMFDLRGAKQ